MINPIKAIKAYFVTKSSLNAIKQEATKMNGTTPGYKTTEFWMHLATQAGTIWAAVQGFVPPKYAIIVTIVGSSVYSIGRTIVKALTDIKTAQTSNTTTVQVESKAS